MKNFASLSVKFVSFSVFDRLETAAGFEHSQCVAPFLLLVLCVGTSDRVRIEDVQTEM